MELAVKLRVSIGNRLELLGWEWNIDCTEGIPLREL